MSVRTKLEKIEKQIISLYCKAKDAISSTELTEASKLQYVDITGDFTFLEEHHGKVLLVDSVTDVDATTAAGLSDGWYCTVQKNNTGNVAIVTGASTTVISDGTSLETQYKSFFIDQQGSDTFHAEGDLV